MKLIIDVPDEQYNLIKLSDKSIFANASSKECMMYAIKNGIPYDERSQDKWIPISERLPKERINPITGDFENVLCSTVWNVIRTYNFGKPRGCDKPHFWHHGVMDEYVTAWQPLPEPYKKTHCTVTSNGDIIDSEGRVIGLI